MAMGMSYSEYMDGEVELAKYYREADIIRQRRANADAWLQGRYIYEALCTATVAVGFPDKNRKVNYPGHPHPITEEEREAEREAEAKLRRQMFIESMNAWAGKVNKTHGS